MLRPVSSSMCAQHKQCFICSWGVVREFGPSSGSGSSRLELPAGSRPVGQGLAKPNNQRPVGGKGLRFFGFLPEAKAEGGGAVYCLLHGLLPQNGLTPNAEKV